MHAVDVVISDEGSGVMPLRGRESDRAWALPYVRDCGEVWEGPWGLIELDGVVVALEAPLWGMLEYSIPELVNGRIG